MSQNASASPVRTSFKSKAVSVMLLFLYVALLGFFFAQVEIQIEGGAGWAANLPTWKIEKHWLLDIFWGGRAMTGYHAWVFSFMALIFHLPFVMLRQWTWRLELRAIGSLAVFWIIEDFLWFVMNPAFDMSRFSPADVPWHKHWFLGVPTDYITLGGVGVLFVLFSFTNAKSKTVISKSAM